MVDVAAEQMNSSDACYRFLSLESVSRQITVQVFTGKSGDKLFKFGDSFVANWSQFSESCGVYKLRWLIPNIPVQVWITSGEADGVLGDPAAGLGIEPTVEVVLEARVDIEGSAGESEAVVVAFLESISYLVAAVLEDLDDVHRIKDSISVHVSFRPRGWFARVVFAALENVDKVC